MEDELMNLEDYKVETEKPILEGKPTITKVKDLLELIGKFAIGIVGLCYILGLLVVNLYLSRFGVYSLSLFRLNYIMAGIWVLSPYFIAFIILSIIFILLYSIPVIGRRIHKWFDLPVEKTKSGLTGVSIFNFLVIFGICINVSIRIIRSLNIPYDVHWISAILVTIMYSFFGIISIRFIRNRLSRTFRPAALYGCLLIVFAIFVSQTYDFSNYLYGTIPPHLGGGGTKRVQLFLKLEPTERQFFLSAGVTFFNDSNRTNTLNLLFTTDDEYVFLIKPQESIPAITLSMRKELIEAVVYENTNGEMIRIHSLANPQ